MNTLIPSGEALAACRIFLQDIQSLRPEFRRSIDEQTGPIQEIVASTREVTSHVDGDRGTVRFVRTVFFKGDRSILVSEDPLRAEMERKSIGWRIVRAFQDDDPMPAGSGGAGLEEVSEAAFPQVVLASPRPVLVHFSADWSAPCRELTKTLVALAEERSNTLTIRRVNVARNGPLAAKYEVKGVPTLLLFHSGLVRSQLVGNVPKADIETFLRANGVAD